MTKRFFPRWKATVYYKSDDGIIDLADQQEADKWGRNKKILTKHSHDFQAMKTALKGYEANRWLPIETAPKDGTRLMLANKLHLTKAGHPIGGHVYFGKWIEGHGKFDSPSFGRENEAEGGYWFDQPTHWQPVPDAPTEGATA